MDQASLREQWEAEERQPFTGWDFSYLIGRMLEDPSPWDYVERAGALMDHAASAIDLDTGGGPSRTATGLLLPLRLGRQPHAVARRNPGSDTASNHDTPITGRFG
jgi:hypothetical protein